jgi:hypothetical protein
LAASIDTLGRSFFHSMVGHFARRDQEFATENRQANPGELPGAHEFRVQDTQMMLIAVNQRCGSKSWLLHA